MYALIDCNNFYTSCERVFKPDLNNKPIVVLSNNDGCVIARSNEAKSCGIPMGAPAFKYRDTFEQHKINVFSSNYALYGDLSSRVMNILSRFSPEIEVYSIDEAFLKFTGFDNYDLQEYGLEMRKKVLQYTGIPVSIGFAPTKALSKVANRVAKKFPDKTGGVYVIDTDEKKNKALKWLKVDDVWGIGRQHAKRLIGQGIITAYNFVCMPDDWVKKQMSIVGYRLKKELEGQSVMQLDIKSKKKAIATTRTFEGMLTDFIELKERVSTFAFSCSEKLRRENSCCNLIMIFIHTNGHRKDLKQYSRNIVVKLPYPSNSAIELSKQAINGLNRIYKDGFKYKKAGVIVMGITPQNQKQINIFEQENLKHPELMLAIDRLNKINGKHIVKLASQDAKRTWKMNQERLSPRYTTRLDEIIRVKT